MYVVTGSAPVPDPIEEALERRAEAQRLRERANAERQHSVELIRACNEICRRPDLQKESRAVEARVRSDDLAARPH